MDRYNMNLVLGHPKSIFKGQASEKAKFIKVDRCSKIADVERANRAKQQEGHQRG